MFQTVSNREACLLFQALRGRVYCFNHSAAIPRPDVATNPNAPVFMNCLKQASCGAGPGADLQRGPTEYHGGRVSTRQPHTDTYLQTVSNTPAYPADIHPLRQRTVMSLWHRALGLSCTLVTQHHAGAPCTSAIIRRRRRSEWATRIARRSSCAPGREHALRPSSSCRTICLAWMPLKMTWSQR